MSKRIHERRRIQRTVLVSVIGLAVLLAIPFFLILTKPKTKEPTEPVDGSRPATASTPAPGSLEGRSAATISAASIVQVAGQNRPHAPQGFSPGVASAPRTIFWWNGFPRLLGRQGFRTNVVSNIRREDYAGAETCRTCHRVNYNGWSRHPHRWMNAQAHEETVQGDFSGDSGITYLGGTGRFYRENDEYRMRLSRDQTNRTFTIRRTIGSRFFQYYIGVMVEGPEGPDHDWRRLEHVLPFGYWIDQKEWVPVVHIGPEVPDGQRDDPFVIPSRDPYDAHCSTCHTTRPLGDWLLTKTSFNLLEYYSPHAVSFQAGAYLRENHADTDQPVLLQPRPSREQFMEMAVAVNQLPAREHALALGINCEACHMGSKAHAQNSTEDSSDLLPMFYPSGPNVLVKGRLPDDQLWRRNAHNVNWVCSRCHSGGRPTFAGGMSTWNSTEYSDAIRGACFVTEFKRQGDAEYLTCVHCHNPHQPTGPKWSRTPAEDDALCLKCHDQFNPATARRNHTRHPDGTPGARCMNCHMPRINEGMQDMVRTHTIFSPTERKNIEANHPNACNLCHLDKPIEWTLKHLRDWYGADVPNYSEAALKRNYPDRDGPVGLGWLNSPQEATRLVAAEALAKAGATWALPQLIEMLDDPYLINRQFTQRRLEEMLGVNLRDLGYRFYQTPQERAGPLNAIRSRDWTNPPR